MRSNVFLFFDIFALSLFSSLVPASSIQPHNPCFCTFSLHALLIGAVGGLGKITTDETSKYININELFNHSFVFTAAILANTILMSLGSTKQFI